MSTDDRDLEALLRRALTEHAQKVVPVGDGLSKIQQRAANRRRRLVWLRPSIAVAAAAIAVVAAIAIPTAIHRMDNGNSGTQAASRPTAASSAISGSTPAKTRPTPKKQPTTLAAQRLTPVAMSWPYSSEKVAARSGDASLTNPEQLATTFVASFTGTTTSKALVAATPTAQGGDFTVDVRRGTTLVSTVQLAPVGQKSYVVTGADGTNVQLSKSALRRTSNSITIGGTFIPDKQAATIWAGTTSGTSKASPIVDSTAAGRTWTLTLNPPNGRVASGPKILAAWTVDQDGQLLDFAAIAAN
jgi:hypothetical protein